jgi:acetyl-CoA acyltransferase
MTDAFIVAGFRTAVGKAYKGGFRFVSPVDLAAEVIEPLLKAIPQLDSVCVDDLIVGNAVPEAEQGLQMARWVGIRSGLPVSVPGVTVNRYCGSGLEAIAIATAKIRTGQAQCVIAGGTESMSLVPTVGFKTVPNYQVAKEHPDYFIGMGLTAEEVSMKYKVTREEQDEFALRSHKRAVAAITEGRFREEIVPVKLEEVYFEDGKRLSRSFTVDTDEGPRKDTSMEVLSKLKPVFKAGGTVTAGNSSQTSDGAAFVIVMSEDMINELNVTPIARLVTCASVGVNPRYMGVGPVEAIPKALKQAGITLDDIDLIELNEAFAAQSVAVVRELGLNTDITNVNGGAIALGHALGSTGARLTVQIIQELKRRNQKYGIVSACIGGGQGIAGVIERLKN